MSIKREDIFSWILWQDPDLMIINKPSGLLCIQDGYDESIPNIRQLISEHFGPIWMVHRLDKETSGVLIIAKNANAHRNLNKQFELRAIKKEYHAIIASNPEWRKKTVDIPLLVNGDRKHRTVRHNEKGKPAITEFQVLSTNNGYALIASFPKSGYRHQIRSHLRELHLAILQDKLYTPRDLISDESTPKNINRLALHAYRISFLHPSTGKIVQFHAPYPADFFNAILRLELIPSD
jgi:RluA family pseudouridine synthase